mgnify:CR=1 FL=1
MEREQYLKNLEVPSGCVDVVLDTDTFNELDDQFAVALLLSHPERFHPVGFCAAPFLNANSSSPEDGMEKSYQELMKILPLHQRKDPYADGAGGPEIGDLPWIPPLLPR